MSSPSPWVAPKSSPTTAPTSASPKRVCRLATIHERADGMRISVVSWRSPAPRMRAFAIRLRSTSRTPWNALKKTTKKTRTAAVAIFDLMSSPSETAKRAPSTTRGIAFAALMYGPRTSDSSRFRPSATPKTTPRIDPTMNPPTASSMVTSACSQSGPSSVPWVIQYQSLSATAVGCDVKKGSIQPSRARISQLPRKTTATSTRRTATLIRRRWASRRRLAARSTNGRAACSVVALMPALSRAGALLTLIAHQDLIPEVIPDLLIDLTEPRLKSNLSDVARPRKVDLVVALDRARSGGDDEDPIAQRDGLFEVVRHEHDRCGAGRPQAQQLVLHERSRLHIQRAERLVHQKNSRVVDQALRQRHALAHAARELIRVAVLESAEAHARDPVPRLLASVAIGGPAVARPGGHIFEHRLPRKDGVRLKYIADPRRDSGHGLTEDVDLAFTWRLQA